ncbi:hypothetical protein NP493_99g01034 [Ridgeia piscesae]|uniref:Uncharacterized protein n=1 Tax=Ridgeia piscesae TaxID=27915 RepID=A0AAD9P7P9_RIDPI|nr:hypothetical protein NP493_99g01034 [Ridgeia piscesae]
MSAPLPFDRPNLFLKRYDTLVPLAGASPRLSDDEQDELDKKVSLQYAAFLREKERKCGPDGFIDSTRYRHNYVSKKDKRASREDKPKLSTVDVALKTERSKSDFTKRQKVIEVHMWQHKQQERELKRVEGDIAKNQRAVRKTLRDFENAIMRKRLTLEKKFNEGLEKYTKLTKDHLHKKDDITKQRIEANMSADQAHKAMGRKVQLVTSNMARKYRTKLGDLELNKTEVDTLSKEFETKLRAKEAENFKLQQELADLALTLNMEAQKGRKEEVVVEAEHKNEKVKRIQADRTADVDLENKLSKSDGDVKVAEVERRRLSANLTLTRAHLQVKQREEGRHKIDTETRLRGNITEQKMLSEISQQIDLEHKAKQIEHNVKVHEDRRKVRASEVVKSMKTRMDQHETHYSGKFQKRYAEQLRREHEDHLKHFQKMVGKGEDQEYNLHNRVKNAEYARQKQEQRVRKLNQQLMELKRKNAVKIKNEMTEVERSEKELEQQLLREQAELTKVTIMRNVICVVDVNLWKCLEYIQHWELALLTLD